MGNGAASGIAAATLAASPDELKETLATLPAADRAKLATALATAESAPEPNTDFLPGMALPVAGCHGHARAERYAASHPENEAVLAWLRKELPEDVLEPNLPIVDPHHHLWGSWPFPGLGQKIYMLPEMLEDMYDGHNVVATVYVQAGSFYRKDGPPELRPVGEVEVMQGMADLCASGRYGPTRLCAGIQGNCDLSHAGVGGVFQEMMKCPNFRGIRAGVHPSKLEDCRPGLELMQKHGLVLDCYNHPPYDPDAISRFAQIATAFADVTMVLNHFGGSIGPGMGDEEVQAKWRADIADLAKTCPNVVCKLGGILMVPNGFDLHLREVPIGSEELAELVLPWYSHMIDCFGPSRCMFESNFPVDKGQVSYRVLWNAFKRVAAKKGLTKEEQADIFHDTAARVYKLIL